MRSIIEQYVGFLEQQLQLYGDEFALDRRMLFSPDQESTADLQDSWENAASLEELQAIVVDCKRCHLAQSRQHVVFGQGKRDADLVLVGEAPGADEDRLGYPFVGKAGDMLNKILTSVKLKREDIYICNILKCRPPNNRDPLPEEIEMCLPYLEKQLEWIEPKVIVCLGRIAAHVLLETNESLSKLRGRRHERKGNDLYVTYHPAALLRNSRYKREVWQDVKEVRHQLESSS